MRAVLLRDNPDIAAILTTMFSLAEIRFDVVGSEEELLIAAEQARNGDILVVDCSRDQVAGIERGLRIITHTAVPIHVVHPHEEFVTTLQAHALGPLTLLSDDFPALSTLEKLRLLRVTAKADPRDPPDDLLSAREREVFHLLGEGRSDAEIARSLALSSGSVKTHIRNIKHKFHGATRTELIAAYHKTRGG